MKTQAMGPAQHGVTTMEDLFRSYWWLIFPLGWFVASGFSSLLNYRRQRDTLKLIQTYAEKGQEPPAALLKVLERPIDADDDAWQTRNQGGRPGDGRHGRGHLHATPLRSAARPLCLSMVRPSGVCHEDH